MAAASDRSASAVSLTVVHPSSSTSMKSAMLANAIFASSSTTRSSPALAVPPAPPLVGGYLPGNINSGLYQDNSIAGGLEVGFYWTDDEKNQFRGEGRVNLPVGSTWNILLETGGTAYYFDDGFSESSIGANAHLWRGAGNLRWGAPSAHDMLPQVYLARHGETAGSLERAGDQPH
jgi:hypothetical protein